MLAAVSGVWSTPARYRLVLSRLNALFSRVIGSFSGVSATGACWSLAAISSSSVCDVPGVPAFDRSGAVNGVQPIAGSTNPLSSALSLPLLMTWAPASAAAFAVLSCAVWPLPLTRYWVVTLSLWSWSIRLKLRVVGHGCPFEDVPSAGMVRLAWLAAL